MIFRPDNTDLGSSSVSAIEYCEKLIAGFKAKANHNKIESQVTFGTVVLASLVSPLFVTLGEGC